MVFRKYIWVLLLCTTLVAEDITVQKKSKKESTHKIKEQLASEFEDLLTLSTHSIKYLTELIDDVVVHVKQLAGQQEGVLVHADKKTLQLYQQKVSHLKKLLQDLDGQCKLGLCL